MDDLEANATGVRNISDDDNNLLQAYGEAHISMSQACTGSKGLFRAQNIAIFNDSYRLGHDIRDNKSLITYSVSEKEKNNHSDMLYLPRVMKLCAKSEICSKLGISIKDFMEMDLNTFTFIEEYWEKLMKHESNETKNILNDHGIDISKL